MRLQLGPELRLQLRPSGTEPKVKLYGEGIERSDPTCALTLASRSGRRPPGLRRTLHSQDGSGGAELAVAGVAEAGDDEGVLVEVLVDGGGVDRQVEAGSP